MYGVDGLHPGLRWNRDSQFTCRQAPFDPCRAVNEASVAMARRLLDARNDAAFEKPEQTPCVVGLAYRQRQLAGSRGCFGFGG